MRAAPPTVLIVDDEELSREIMAAHLEDCGYPVALAEDGEAALRVLERQHDRIAIAVVDDVMPGMSGSSLLRVFEQRYPGLPAILMTVFKGNWWYREDYAYPWEVGVLIKPSPLAELETMVRDGLARFGA